MTMSVSRAQQTMQAYADDLLQHGNFAQHFSDDVEAILEGADQRYQGRDMVRQWIEGAHSLGEIKVRNLFTGEVHAAGEFDFVRKDGVVVPYTVIYDLTDGKITALRLYFTGPIQT
jgi:hypothetical protein